MLIPASNSTETMSKQQPIMVHGLIIDSINAKKAQQLDISTRTAMMANCRGEYPP